VIQPPRRRLAIAHRASRSHLRMMMARDYACRPWFWGNHAVTLSSLGLSHVRTINVVEIQRTYVLDRGARRSAVVSALLLKKSLARKHCCACVGGRAMIRRSSRRNAAGGWRHFYMTSYMTLSGPLFYEAAATLLSLRTAFNAHHRRRNTSSV